MARCGDAWVAYVQGYLMPFLNAWASIFKCFRGMQRERGDDTCPPSSFPCGVISHELHDVYHLEASNGRALSPFNMTNMQSLAFELEPLGASLLTAMGHDLCQHSPSETCPMISDLCARSL